MTTMRIGSTTASNTTVKNTPWFWNPSWVNVQVVSVYDMMPLTTVLSIMTVEPSTQRSNGLVKVPYLQAQPLARSLAS